MVGEETRLKKKHGTSLVGENDMRVRRGVVIWDCQQPIATADCLSTGPQGTSASRRTSSHYF